MKAVEEEVGALELDLESIAGAHTPAEVFRAVLRAARRGAPRLAMFLVRREAPGRLKGWTSVGYPRPVGPRLRSVDAPASEIWFGRALEAAQGEAVVRGAEDAAPDLGQPDAAEALAFALRAEGRPLAVLVAERGVEEVPWRPGLLRLLLRWAAVRLELELARRRLRVLSRPEAAEPSTDESARASGSDVSTGEAPPAGGTGARGESPSPAETGVAPAEVAPPVLSVRRSRQDEARTFARLVATDIRLYNEEAVMLGRRHRDLQQRLADQLDRGRHTFLRRFPDLGEARAEEMLHDAYVQVLAGGDSDLLPRD